MTGVIDVDPANPEPAAIQRAVQILLSGGIVAYPTDTLYGLAIDPRRPDACERLFALKGREAGMPVPFIAASLEQVNQIAIFGDGERRLARAFWPGPLTIVATARPSVSRRLLAGGSRAAVCVPAHAVAQALAAALGTPISSTSANRSGEPPASASDAIRSSLGDIVDLVLDAGPAPGGAPSTIVDLLDGPRLIRAGAVAWERVLKSLE